MIRFVLVFVLSFSVSLLLVYYTAGVIAPVFSELMTAFVILALLAASLSYALFNYIDSIVKDVAADRESLDTEKYGLVMRKLASLKREVLVNATAIGGLLLSERLVYGISLVLSPEQGSPFTWGWAASISFRVACFGTSFLLAGVQYHGFIIANEYRSIISQQK